MAYKGFSVEVKGLNKVIRNLQELKVDVGDMKSAFNRIGNIVVAEASQRAPYRTGVLRQSIRAGNAKNKATIRAGSARARYAPFMEFGTYKDKEVAFMRGAANSKRKRVVYELDKELKILVRKANN